MLSHLEPILCGKSGVSNTRAACGPRGPSVRPAMLFGTFQIMNIYIAKCLEKRCRKVIEPNLNDAQCGFRLGPSNIDQISLSSKFLRNLESMPNTSTHALSNSRKHTTGFLLKRFVERCGSMVLTDGRPSSNCIPDQKVVSVSGE